MVLKGEKQGISWSARKPRCCWEKKKFGRGICKMGGPSSKRETKRKGYLWGNKQGKRGVERAAKQLGPQ